MENLDEIGVLVRRQVALSVARRLIEAAHGAALEVGQRLIVPASGILEFVPVEVGAPGVESTGMDAAGTGSKRPLPVAHAPAPSREPRAARTEKHSAAFRADVIRAVAERGPETSVADVCERLKVHPSLFYYWKKTAKK